MVVRIRCTRREGIWRAGVFHPAEWVEHPAAAFNEEQQQLLQGERLLEIEAADETLPAKEMVLLVGQAESLEELDALLKGEQRKSVLAAVDKRRAALGAAA